MSSGVGCCGPSAEYADAAFSREAEKAAFRLAVGAVCGLDAEAWNGFGPQERSETTLGS